MKKFLLITVIITSVTVFISCSNKQQKVSYQNYTVRFDKNTTSDNLEDDESFTYYTTGWGAQKKTSVITIPYSEEAVVPLSEVPNPTRKGYYFAGWQTVPVVNDEDIINGVSKYLFMADTKLSDLGKAKYSVLDKNEIKSRNLCNDAMYIKDIPTLKDDGTVTLYARWIKAKSITTEQELREIGNDLYGAYILENDIYLTDEWTPIGAYFNNYEYFNDSWWTYAFRGNFDGNGHTIYNLKVNGAELNMDYVTNEPTVWHKDGNTARGTAAMFGAVCYANIKNLVIENALINVSDTYSFDGDYCYAAVLTCFDMASTIKNVKINNSVVSLDYSDTKMNYAQNLFVSAAGLEAGGWSSTISDCSLNNVTVNLNTVAKKTHGGEVYVGSLIGECYATIKNSSVDSIINVKVIDESKADKDSLLTVNVGGFNAANTSSTQNTVNALVNAQVSKKDGMSNINIGGFTGSQRYQSAEKNTINTVLYTDINTDENKSDVNIGSIMGRLDPYYSTLILMYADETVCGARDNEVNVLHNGKAYTTKIPDSGYPSTANGKIEYIATQTFTSNDGVVFTKNIDEIIEKYGSYLPKDSLTNRILYIKVY